MCLCLKSNFRASFDRTDTFSCYASIFRTELEHYHSEAVYVIRCLR